ncbi:MAG: glycogen synthase [Clostridia bacterium]|nr:glycogen synthase [Clostridia bacterium]
MKIAFVASEAAPFAKTGGLGDVASALPAALAAAGHEVAVILPLYRRIKTGPDFASMRFLTSFEANLSWRRQYAGVFTARKKPRAPRFYFIDNEYYFGRDGAIYGEYDDGERFAFFSLAALGTLEATGFMPDVIHCNDWQTAALPVFLRTVYRGKINAATLFTIHNIEYQGRMPLSFAGDVMGLGGDDARLVEFDGCVNLMKGALVTADAVSTVSRTYAREILDPYYSHGLDGVLASVAAEGRLSGIVNGIDTRLYNPSSDPALAAGYSAGDLSGKRTDKAALQKELGLRVDADLPLCGMVTRLASHKGIDLVERVLDETADAGVQFAILGTGEKRFEDFFREAAARRPGMIAAVIGFSGSLASKIYAASDLFLMPSKSEPCGLAQLVAMRYGAVPVVRETGGLADTVPAYDPATGEGRGFTFKSYNAHDMKDAVLRGARLFRDSRDEFERLRTNCMLADFSWRASTGDYVRLYEKIKTRG